MQKNLNRNGLYAAALTWPMFNVDNSGGAGQGQAQGQQGGQPQGQPQGNGAGQQQFQQGQPQGQGGGILNDPTLGDQGQSNGGQGFQPQGQGQQTAFMSQEQVQQLLAAQDQKWQSEIDRRINQIVQKGRVPQPTGQQGQQQLDNQGQGQQQQQPQVQAPVVDTGAFDQREARLAYMQYVGDEIRFLNADERNLAASLATAQIPELIEGGNTPNDAGLKVAKDVATQIRGLRTQYEGLVIQRLKQKGALSETFGTGEGQATTQQGGVGPTSDWQKGVARAQEMFPVNGQQNSNT